MSKMSADLLRVSRRLRWVAVTIPATPPPTTTIRCISLALLHRFCLAWAGSLTCNRFNVLRRITEIWGAGFGMSREFFRAEHGPRRRHWLADDAVSCEPVSAPNSLLTEK